MTRHRDWHRRLTGFLAQTAKAKLEPGKHDPLVFVAGAVQAMTGTDIAADLRGYRSEGGLAKRIEAVGGFEGWLDMHLPRAARPRPGDVVLLSGGGLGIWQGTRAYGVAGDGWIITVENETPKTAWSV